jgi:hypothetical protein
METIHPNVLNRCCSSTNGGSGAFYYRLDVCNLCKLLFQTQSLSNYPTIIIFYLYNNIPQVNNKCIIKCKRMFLNILLQGGQRTSHFRVFSIENFIMAKIFQPNRRTSCESASLPQYLGCNTANICPIIIYFHSSQCRLIPYFHQRPIFFSKQTHLLSPF